MNCEISIVIVSYNNPVLLKQTICSIREKIKQPESEIILVDNASSDNNIFMIEKNFPEVKLLKNKTNFGFGKACNLGAKQAAGKYLLFVNSDIYLEGNPLPEMIEILEKNKNIGSLGVQLHNPNGTRQPSGFRFPALSMRFIQLTGLKNFILKIKPSLRINDDRMFNADFVSGAFFMLEKQLFNEIGGFDERYFMYLEDADLCYQIVKKGKKNYILNRNDVIHLNENHENSSTPFVFYHLNRGHLLFYQKNYSKYKTNFLRIMSRIIFTLKLNWLYLRKNSPSEIEKYKHVLSIF